MRQCFLALGLIAVALVLQGCGGGGGGATTTAPPSPGPTPSPGPGPTPAPGPSPPAPAGKCLNKQAGLVTQSLTGTTAGNLQATVKASGSLPIPPGPIDLTESGDFTLKFSLENFQIRADLTSKVTVYNFPVTESSKIIFDASKSEDQLVAWYSVDFMGKTTVNCTISTITEMPSPEALKKYVQEATQAFQGLAKCSGSSDNYDTWSVSSSDVLPNPNVSVGIDATMSKDYLWHEVDLHLDKLHLENQTIGSSTIESMDASGKVTMTVTKATPDAPAASDLDHSGFGKCTKLPPTELRDLDMKAALHKLPGVALNQHLLTLLTSLQSQKEASFVV